MAFSDKTEYNKVELEFIAIEKQALWSALFHKIKFESMKKNYSLDEAKKANNKFLNRYRDVNPYDHSRVELTRDDYNYINASHIDVKEARRKYILTQGPLPNTVVHFWLMVWEQNSKAIIMLNKVIEKNQTKCSQYWPELVGEDNALTLPEVDLRVDLLSEEDYSHYVVRNLRLTNVADNESREIIQYHYTTWPDFGVPQSPLTFLKFLRDIRQSDAFRSDVGPPIVHCSAGIGRSGTFCLVDSILVLMDLKGVENVSIKDVLLEMRTYRMGLIQTADQLKFSYVAIIQGLKVKWDADNNDGLPEDELSLLENGNSDVLMLSAEDILGANDDDEPPPLPPPRYQSLDKPLPTLPGGSSSEPDSESDECSLDSSDLDDDETLPITDVMSSEDIRTPWDDNIEKIPPVHVDSVPASRKRKFSETKEKSQRIQNKVQEMKKKQTDAESRKKKRSLLTTLILGLSFLAIAGGAIAYFKK